MERTTVSTKTIAEVEEKNNIFLISTFADMNEDGTTTPSIYKSQVLEEPKIVDNQDGKEGELILSFEGDKVGSINSTDGTLTITPENDDADKYNKNNQGDLIYNG